jgi:hypothetical protein
MSQQEVGMAILRERMRFDGDADFLKLVRMYLNDDSEDLQRKSGPHFRVILDKHPGYLDHPTVLGLSLGGSFTKAVLASTSGGSFHISHLAALQNPDEPQHFYDFLDRLLIGNLSIFEYLKSDGPRALGIALPVMITEDDIPYHPTKIKAVEGVFARGPEQMGSELNVPSNLLRYFESRNLPAPTIYFEADPIVAHLGGASLIDLPRNEQSLLLVCGTGMAIADYEVSRTISRLPMQDFDEELFPRDETEDYGFEYGFDGVGLYGFMNRAIQIRAREEDSHLDHAALDQYFQNRYDSKTVSELWESTLDGLLPSEKVLTLSKVVDPEGMRELQEIACEINRRIVGSLANAMVAVAIKLDRDRGPHNYRVIYEGGIALNPNRLPLIKHEIGQILKKDNLFQHLGVSRPTISFEELPQREVLFQDSADEALRSNVDISLIGTAAGAIAHHVLSGADSDGP